MKINVIRASRHNYNAGTLRSAKAILYIILHYTAGDTDTAKNEGIYFSKPHDPKTSAHYFVDRDGVIVESVNPKYTAYSVGGKKYPYTAGGTYYGKAKNSNSISIEMCGTRTKDASAKQIASIKWLIKYLQGKYPNAKTIIRHYDVTGKICPARYIDATKWKALKKAVTK